MQHTGHSTPLGATVVAGGVNVSLFSRSATGVELLLFDRDAAARPARVLSLDPVANRTYYSWMIGGFAMVAYPAQYGSSGIMIFMVNYDGVVYEKDVGPHTTAMAQSMTKFNPDETWKQRSPSLETGENHPRCIRSSSTTWRSDRTQTVRV
jgi:pullulanase/glycogen debranching enzyme